MPLGFWLPLLGVFILIGTMLNLPWPVFFAVAVGLVIGLAQYLKQRALNGVTYRRRWIYTRGFPGETSEMTLEVENRKRFPLSWLRITDSWPWAVPLENRALLTPSHQIERGLLTNLFSLHANQSATRKFPLRFEKRGIHTVGPAELESGDLFGIYEKSETRGPVEVLTVFPEILPLSALHLPTKDPFGDRQALRNLFEDPNRTIGVRSYHPEDEMRRIHWPATARTGQLQVRMYQPISARVMMIGLNVSTSEVTWQGSTPETLEQMVKISATLAYHGIEAGYSVGLVSNGAISRSDRSFHFLPGRTQSHLALLLQALAGVSPITIAPFETTLMKTLPQIPFGATLLLVSAHITPTLINTLFTLQRVRPHTTLISIATEIPPEIPGVRVIHLPFQE